MEQLLEAHTGNKVGRYVHPLRAPLSSQVLGPPVPPVRVPRPPSHFLEFLPSSSWLCVPLLDSGNIYWHWGSLVVDGRPHNSNIHSVSPDYFVRELSGIV